MNYLEVDADFIDHPILMELGRDVLYFHVCALAFCAREWTGGFIPVDEWGYLPNILRNPKDQTISDYACIAELVKSGLWVAGEDGYTISAEPHLPRWRLRRGHGGANQDDRYTSAYRNWRNYVLQRDGYQCTECGRTNDLQAHHIKEFAAFPLLRFEPSNGITLCLDCHSDVHGRRLG